MNTIQLTQQENRSILKSYNQVLDGIIINSESDETKLEFDNDKAIGFIQSVNLNNGISYVLYDMTARADFELINEAQHSAPVYFVYCSEDDLIHSFGVEGSLRKLGQFQTSILTSTIGADTVFHFVKDRDYKVLSIQVDTEGYENAQNTTLNKKLVANFNSVNDAGNFAYVGSFNLKIADKITQLKRVTQKGIVRTFLLNGIIHSILGLEIQQHTDDTKNTPVRYANNSLTKEEMGRIKDLALFIEYYPEREYTIKSLCTRVGMSSSKLQKGFKALYDRTVTDYIRHKRIDRAENLIKTTDLNISEVVYSIGLTSRSYFSKIFKKKYNCSPKQYQDRRNSFVVTA